MVDQSINRYSEAPRQSVLYLYPDDVAEYHQTLRTNGVAVPDLDETFYGMTEFRLLDLEGNPCGSDRRDSAARLKAGSEIP